MYCRNCNMQYPKGAMFCNVCGNALEPPIIEQQAQPIPQQEDSFEQIDPQYVVKKPTSKKKIIAIALSAVGCLALIVGLLYYILVINHPINKIKNAFDNTLDQLMVNTPTLSEVYHNLRELTEDREFTAKLDYVYSVDWTDGDTRKESVKFVLNYDAGGEEMSGEADISTYSGYSDSVDCNLLFSADDEDIYVRLKQLGRDVYSMPLADFGEQYKDSALADMVDDDEADDILSKLELNPYADFSFSTFCTDTDEGKEFIESLNLEKSDDKIPHTKDLTVYRMQIKGDDLSDALNAYAEFVVTQLCGEKAAKELDLSETDEYEGTYVIYIGINDDDCIVALYGYKKGDKDDAILISLEGEENIWDEVVVYSGDDKDKFFVEQKKDGFELYREYDDRSPKKLFECDDGDCELIIYDGSSEEVVINYSDEDDGANFKLSQRESYESEYSYYYSYYRSTDLEFSIVPLEDIEMIDDDPIAIMDMSKRKLEDLIDELEDIY